MAKAPVELEPPLDQFIALLGSKTVAGGQDKDRVTPQAERFCDRLAMIIERAGVVRRI